MTQPAELPSVSLAPVESNYIALRGDTMDVIQVNLKRQPLSLDLFDVVKSPAGGATVFSVPRLDGDEAEKELTGIILDYTTPRAYWDTPDPVEGTPPVCMSRDSMISEDGKPCAHCPFNDFGSKDGESSAKGVQGIGAALSAAAQHHPAPAGPGARDQQAPVPEIRHPAAELRDTAEQRGHQDYPGEGDQQGGEALRPL